VFHQRKRSIESFIHWLNSGSWLRLRLTANIRTEQISFPSFQFSIARLNDSTVAVILTFCLDCAAPQSWNQNVIGSD
jgi:hypothetical protein